jgi:hypothetical protein
MKRPASRYLRERKLKRCEFIDDEGKNYPLKILCKAIEFRQVGFMRSANGKRFLSNRYGKT